MYMRTWLSYIRTVEARPGPGLASQPAIQAATVIPGWPGSSPRPGLRVLSHNSGLGSGGPGLPVEPAWRELMSPPSGPVSTEDAMYEAMGYDPVPVEQPGYPGIAELRARMGI